jgi:PTH1 family peptidyl-tRNA hydrolase
VVYYKKLKNKAYKIMILIVGLGNPGEKYEKTRHNIGFKIVDSLKLKVNSFSNWEKEKYLELEISKGTINGENVVLVKPQTFMNKSGEAVKKMVLNLKSEILNLIVVHDDIDLPIGKIKISRESGSAGHKGVSSIIDNLGTKDFIRFRVGIQPKKGKPKQVENFVIKKFSKDEEKILEKIIPTTTEAIETALDEGTEKAMNKFN